MKRKMLTSQTALKLCVPLPSPKPEKCTKGLSPSDSLPAVIPSQNRFVNRMINKAEFLKKSRQLAIQREIIEESPKRIKMDHSYSTKGADVTNNDSNEPKQTASGNKQTNEPKQTVSGKNQTNEPKQTVSGKNQTNEPKQTVSGNKQTNEPKQTVSGKNQTNEPKQTGSGKKQTNEPKQTVSGNKQTNEPKQTVSGKNQTNEPKQTGSGKKQTNEAKPTKSSTKSNEGKKTKSDYIQLSKAKQTEHEYRQSFILLQEISFHVLAQKGNSVLFDKGYPGLTDEETFFQKILHEMETKVPFLFDLLDNICGNNGNKTYTMCTIYGMIMHSRNYLATAVQKYYTAAAIKHNTENKFLHILNRINMTISPQSKRALKREIVQQTQAKIDDSISATIQKTQTASQMDDSISVTTNNSQCEPLIDDSISAILDNSESQSQADESISATDNQTQTVSPIDENISATMYGTHTVSQGT
ncbi:hypothetical protein ACF0H5_008577 [Mactra antiquata]